MTVDVPLFPPLQETFVCVAEAVIVVAGTSVNVFVSVQLLASVIVTV